MRKSKDGLTRRDVLVRSAAGAALVAPWFVPAAALGREGKAAASARITLGVIGIGPRCTYDLQAMLKQPDVQCVAVCDVQASRREAGKKLVDEHYKTKDCATYRDFHELLARRDIDAVLIAIQGVDGLGGLTFNIFRSLRDLHVHGLRRFGRIDLERPSDDDFSTFLDAELVAFEDKCMLFGLGVFLAFSLARNGRPCPLELLFVLLVSGVVCNGHSNNTNRGEQRNHCPHKHSHGTPPR